MSNENESTTVPTTQPGPNLLTERTLAGIFVHLLGLGTGFVGTSFIYLLSDNDFTRSNARNATNWQLLYWGVHLGWLSAIGALFLFDSVFPDSTPFDAILVGLFVAVGIAFFLTSILLLIHLAFILVASGKAVFGTAWEYPIAPDFVGWIQNRTPDQTRWWVLISVYALVAPILFGYLSWLVISDGPEAEALFFASFFLVVFSMLASLFTLVALYRDASKLEESNADWQPNWLPYVGIPLGASALTYLFATTYFRSVNPAGDAVYGFMFALWIVAVVYLCKRYWHLESS
ncbi:DUF4870 domain-containing protein [Halostagnicola bangensis]